MKKFKKLLIAVLSVCMLACFGAFAVGCNDNNDGDKCNHENVIICETCGAVVQGNEYYVNYVKSGWSSLGAGKGYSVDIDLSASTGEGEEWYETAEDYECVETVKTEYALKVEDFFFGFDNENALYFEGSASLSIKSYSDANTVFKVTTLNLSEAKLDGTELTYAYEAKVDFPELSEELKEINKTEEADNETLDLEEFLDVEDEDFQPIMILTDILPMVVDCYEDILLPYAKTILDANKVDVNNAVANAIDTLFAVKKVNGNNVYTMDALGANIKQISVMLDTDISVLFDSIFGAGQYDKLPQTINALLDYKVSDVLNLLAQKGITVDGLIGVADQLIQKIMGETVTFEAFLSQMIGAEIDVSAIIDAYKDKTVKELIKEFSGLTDDEINNGITYLIGLLAQYKEMSIYDIAEVDEEIKAMITEAVNVIANMLDEALDVELVLDGSGNIVSTNVGIVFDTSKPATAGFVEWIKGVAEIEEFPELVINLEVGMSVANIPA